MLSFWKWIRHNKITFSVFLFLTFMTVPWRQFYPFSVSKALSPPQIGLKGHSEKIAIGIVTCAGGFSVVVGRDKAEIKAMAGASEEALTLIKSVLISAKFSKPIQVEFHILTDSWKLETTIQRQLKRYNATIKSYVHMTAHFYSVFDAVPHGFERDFVDNIRRCGYVRLFLPRLVSSELKEILYLDTDVIVTGNILNIWNKFKTQVVTNANTQHKVKLAGLIQNSEVFGKKFLDVYKSHFKMIPHVPPRGVNSGVMFMNLEKMRAFNWTGKIVEIFKKRRSTLQGDQQLVNVFFHDNLETLALLPCQYNFQHLHCELGFSCRNATTDPGGIQLMHGAGGMFHAPGRSHAWIYEAFKKFQLKDHWKVVDELYRPLKRFYGKLTGGKATCYGTIGKYLFKELIN